MSMSTALLFFLLATVDKRGSDVDMFLACSHGSLSTDGRAGRHALPGGLYAPLAAQKMAMPMIKHHRFMCQPHSPAESIHCFPLSPLFYSEMISNDL